MKKMGIIYGSSTGTCESIAQTIAEKLGVASVDVIDASKITTEKVGGYDILLLGTSTWGDGELQDDWYDAIKTVKTADLNGKIVALFGCGDSESYCDTFCDGMGVIYDQLKNSGCTFVGAVPADEYSYSSSIAVIDGKFVEKSNLELMKDYATTVSHNCNIPLDVHLMVENVEEVADEYIDLAPDRVTFHIEALKDKDRIFNFIQELKENNIKVGIAISPETQIEELKPYLKYIHMVLVMTVVPGKGGQKIIPETLEKIRSLKKYLEENSIDIDIEADGGINGETSEDVREAGADILVSGFYVVSAENKRAAVEKIRG